MPIVFDEKKSIFHIQTNNSSYVMGLLNNKYLVHVHYGKRVNTVRSIEDRFPIRNHSNAPVNHDLGYNASIGTIPMEYPTFGSTDLRTPAFHAVYENGSTVTQLHYDSHEIYCGKRPLKGLPSVYEKTEGEAQSLDITLKDEVTGLKVILTYSIFEGFDAIVKSVRVVNATKETVNIQSVLSSNVDFYAKKYDFIHLHGDWAKERQIERRPAFNGVMKIDSARGASSAQHNPFFALADKNADEKQGDVFGFSFVYSGNFSAGVEADSYNISRAFIGINPFNFNWKLESGEEFSAPEAVLVYSSKGFGEMSRTYHKLYRTHLCRSKYSLTSRPILINNWEATYFDFNEEKIVNIAKKAKEAGIDLMVLDDGWFGKRDDDKSGLGDWVVNRNKLPNGLDGLADKVNALGMKFGLWFEPEMVSPDSDLYRAHPDWCIHVENRHRNEGRNQLILDLSRDDVCDYIIDAVGSVLAGANISYVKWDMNRNMSEFGSALLPADRQREMAHRYMLGLYRVLETLTKRFPDVLFEGCASGGCRFDPGMLYYFCQIWTSDDSDAIERLFIQHGTSMVYPASSMGAHVSAVPNHQVNRVTPIKTRGNVALPFQFGYELDLSTLTDEEFEEVKAQVKLRREIEGVCNNGEMYRIASPFEENYACWQFISEDKNTVIVFHYTILGKPNYNAHKIYLQGLCPDAKYVKKGTDEVYGGDELMYCGIMQENLKDFDSNVMIFEKI